MKKYTLIIILISLGLNLSSQIKYETGYFIKNSGEKVNCLIKNKDWENNPTKFEYKLSEDSKSSTETIDNVIEFSSDNMKYERQSVLIDRSSSNINNYSEKREPDLKKEQLFLKILIEGKASLYYYRGKNITRFFYSVDSIKTEQLIYKDYLAYEQKKPDYLPEINGNITKYSTPISGEKTIHKVNDKYRFQLLSNLKSESITRTDIYQTAYKTKDLTKIFIKYNESMNSEYTEYRKKRNPVNFSLKAGINYTSFEMMRSTTNETFNFDADFGFKFNFRLGIETEVILPFNKNKWSLYFEPTYQYYKANKEITYLNSGVFVNTTYVYIDYKSLLFPIGVKYSMFLKKDSKIFLNAALILDQGLNSEIFYEKDDLIHFKLTSLSTGFHLGLFQLTICF